jgi:hypothetical protein
MHALPLRQGGTKALLPAAALAVLLAWGWFDVRARAAPATGGLGQKTDITVYLDAASAIREGRDIYPVRNVRGWPYLYPPLPALIFVPLSHLSRQEAAYVWFLASLACIAGSVLLMRGALRKVHPQWADKACLLGLVPIALPMLHTLQRGQINALPLLCLCLGMYALARQRDLLAGVALGGAAAIKVTPGFVAVYFAYKWLAGQASAVREGTWRPATLVRRTRPLAGLGLGLLLGLWLIPGLYMGLGQAVDSLAKWRQTVVSGYFSLDASGDLFGDTRGIHDASNKNQTWYRAVFSTVGLLDADALKARDVLERRWQHRMGWILAAIGAAVVGAMLYLSRGNWSGRTRPAIYAELAAFAWLGITFGKIAWPHFYVMAYPLAAVACLLAWGRPAAGPARPNRQLQIILGLVTVAYAVEYIIASQPRVTDIGGMLLPTTVLAFATVAMANRQ